MREGWEVKKLEECFKLKSGDGLTSKMMGEDGKYPVFGGNGIAGKYKDFNLSGKNVIIGRVGALCGNVRYLNENIWLTDNAFRIVDFKYQFDHTFLTYLLNYKNLREYARQAAQPVISNSSLKDVILKFPSSLREQQRIVAILDKAFAAIAKAKANAEQNLKNAKELFESYLQGVFERKGEGWEEKRFEDLCKLTRGHNPPKSKFVSEPKEGYIRFYQIRDGWADDYAVYVPITPQLHRVEPDEILMVAYRHIGKVFRGVSGAFNVALCKISNKNREKLDDDYLFYVIPTDIVKGELMKRSERSLIPSMSVEHLKEILIPLPSLIEQKKIVHKLDGLSAETKKLEANYQQKINDLEELKKSILQKAFSGEL